MSFVYEFKDALHKQFFYHVHQDTVKHCLTGCSDHSDQSQSTEELECHNLSKGKKCHHGAVAYYELPMCNELHQSEP